MSAHTHTPLHPSSTASEWVVRWSHLLAPRCTVLDVACGQGRHVHHLAKRGHAVVGLDRSPEALDATRLAVAALFMPALAQQLSHAPPELLCADIEAGPWPLPGRRFGGVVVTNYLWRPLWPQLLASLAPAGVLIYETFSVGNASVGKPARPDFLLQSGELLTLCQGLRVVAFEEGFLSAPERFVQRIVAVRQAPNAPAPTRYPLSAALT